MSDMSLIGSGKKRNFPNTLKLSYILPTWDYTSTWPPCVQVAKKETKQIGII